MLIYQSFIVRANLRKITHRLLDEILWKLQTKKVLIGFNFAWNFSIIIIIYVNLL